MHNTAPKITRRRFLRLILGTTAMGGLATLGGAGYATLVEPYWPAVKRVNVPLPGLPAHLDGFTITQLSDLHRGPVVTQEDIGRAVALALEQEADLAVLTGDYVSSSAKYAPSCAQALAPLASSSPLPSRERPGQANSPLPPGEGLGQADSPLPLREGLGEGNSPLPPREGLGEGGALASLGNHDHWTDADTVAGALSDAGLTVLRNAAREVADGLWIAAVDDVWEQRADLDQALADVPASATVVLLAHEPDYADTVAAGGRVSLQLSGHSHGGQIRVPFVGPLVLPRLAHKYPAGLYRVSRMWLYVNRGVGLVRPAVRFNCRPEVTLLKLQATDDF